MSVIRIICPRCGRRMVGWPLARPDVCSPKDWVDCIRSPYVEGEQ